MSQNKLKLLNLLRDLNKELDCIDINNNLNLTLQELSELNQIKIKLNNLNIINQFYPQKNTSLINGNLQNSIHLNNIEQNLFKNVENTIKKFKEVIKSLDKHRIYILNQSFNTEKSIHLLKIICEIAF